MSESKKTETTETKTEQQVQERPLGGVAVTAGPEKTETKTETVTEEKE